MLNSTKQIIIIVIIIWENNDIIQKSVPCSMYVDIETPFNC